MKVRSLAKLDYWRYISFKEYLADLATREVLPGVIVNKDSLWFGPQFSNSLHAEDWHEIII